MKPYAIRVLGLTAVLSALFCITLLAVRGFSAISLMEPLQGQTRGAEYESLFPIWKVIQGLPLYADLTRIPFAATYYNWLYYVSYAGVSEAVMRALALGDEWIPTITRLTTLTGAICGAVLMYASTIRLCAARETWFRIVTASLAVTVFLGPLTGYFAITTTPDIWPVTLAVCALWVFIAQYDKHPLATVLAICLMSYLAWAFKQNFLHIPATIGLFLLLRRKWTHAGILTVVSCAGGFITLAVGGAEYRKMLLFGETHLSLTFEQLGINLINMTAKTLPVLALAAGLLVLVLRNADLRRAFAERFRDNPALALPIIGVFISAIEAIPTSAIVAAAENHYFYLIYFAATSALVVMHTLKLGNHAFVGTMLTAGFIGNAVAISAVFLGLQGTYSVRYIHDSLTEHRKCLEGLSRSIFVDDARLMLPWMVPANEHFVLEFSYDTDRAKGVEFEAGGVGGLIDKGYFEHIAILKWRGRQIDGSDLEQYPVVIKTCPGMVVYGRVDQGGRAAN